MNLPSAQILLEAADAGRTLTPTERGRYAQGACGPTSNSRSDPTTGPPGGNVMGFDAGFDAAEAEAQALAVQDEIIALRRARGERTVGYKIGFTNRTIWPVYGVHQPIWGPVWNTSLHRLAGTHVDINLAALAEPRLEPEIVIGLRHSPPPDADARTLQSLRRLIDCVEWVAPGFEIVRTHPPERIQAYNAVGFRYRTVLCGRKELHHGALFSSSPDASQLLLMDAESVPYMLVTYSVRTYTPPRTTSAPYEGGHTLLVTGSYLRTPTELEVLCTRRPVERHVVLNAIQSHHRDTYEDAYLKAYRHRVLYMGNN